MATKKRSTKALPGKNSHGAQPIFNAWFRRVALERLDEPIHKLDATMALELFGPMKLASVADFDSVQVVRNRLETMTLREIGVLVLEAQKLEAKATKKRSRKTATKVKAKKKSPPKPTPGNSAPAVAAVQTDVESYVANAPAAPSAAAIASAGNGEGVTTIANFDEPVASFLVGAAVPEGQAGFKLAQIAVALELDTKTTRACLRRLKRAGRADTTGNKKAAVWHAARGQPSDDAGRRDRSARAPDPRPG